MRRFCPVLLITIALVCISIPETISAKSAKPKPNIVFILADDLGYGDLGCFGQRQIKTPCLDKMASEGIRFTSACSGSTVCAPSRCTLMTGLHTGHGRIRGNSKLGILPEDRTVAELLKQAGYYTGLIGKWGLGDETTTGAPNKKGFDESFGYLDQVHAHSYYPGHLIKDGQRFPLPGNVNNQQRQYSHDLFAAASLDFIERNQHRPFFLYLAFTIPHAKMEVPSDEPYSDKPWPQPEKNKAAMITRMDKDIGQFIEKLKQLNLDTNTIIFFASDNGPHHEGGVATDFLGSRGPLRGCKRDMYEGGIRVPAIVRWPDKIKPCVSDFPWAFWDFLPTACELAGVAAPRSIDGDSILPTLLGKKQKPHPFFYWEFHEGGSKQAVRMGDWKAVRLAPGAPLELYNLAADLGEQTNVASSNPKVVKRIEKYLATARSYSENWPIIQSANQKKKIPLSY